MKGEPVMKQPTDRINARQAALISGVSIATVLKHLNKGCGCDTFGTSGGSTLSGIPPEYTGGKEWQICASDFWRWFYEQWHRGACLMYDPNTARGRAAFIGFKWIAEGEINRP